MVKKSNRKIIVIVVIIIIMALLILAFLFLKKKPTNLKFGTAPAYGDGFKTIEAIEKTTDVIDVNTNPFEEKETNLIEKIYKNPFK